MDYSLDYKRHYQNNRHYNDDADNDDLFKAATSGLNLLCTKILGDDINDMGFKSKDTWHDEFTLEKDLAAYQRRIYDETAEFENKCNEYNNESEAGLFSGNALTDSVSETGYFVTTLTSEKKGKKLSFRIPDNCHVINNIMLQIDVTDVTNKIDLSDEDKLLLCNNSTVTLSIGGQSVNKRTIMMSLFTELFGGKNVISDNGIMQIPIYNFANMKLLPYLNGLPICNLQWHKTIINIELGLLLPCKLVVCGYELKHDIITKLSKNRFELILLQNQEILYNVIPNKSITLRFDMVIKALFIQFIQNSESIYPEIETITLTTSAGGRSSTLNYGMDEIHDITIYGNRIYIVPLCENFATIPKIRNSIKTGMNADGIDFNRLEDVNLDIKYANDVTFCDYGMLVSCINLNVLRISDNMAGVEYN